jgi:hypothetical protein
MTVRTVTSHSSVLEVGRVGRCKFVNDKYNEICHYAMSDKQVQCQYRIYAHLRQRAFW